MPPIHPYPYRSLGSWAMASRISGAPRLPALLQGLQASTEALDQVTLRTVAAVNGGAVMETVHCCH